MKPLGSRSDAHRWAGPMFVLVALLVLAGVAYWRLRPVPTLIGDYLSNPYPAPDFTLTDQFGHPETLSRFRGRPVALTFIYTNCPDVCPLIASNLHAAYQQLGPDAQRVRFLAVTVDPERDTVAQIRQFSIEHGLLDEWLFTTGARPNLERVWKAYGIDSRPVDSQGRPLTPIPSGTAQSSPEIIEHSAFIFLIDQRGKVRTLLSPTDFSAADLATDLRILLSEPSN